MAYNTSLLIQIEKIVNYSYNNYNNIMQSNNTQNQIFLNTILEQNSNSFLLLDPCQNTIPYIKRGDSELYIQQFLSLDVKQQIDQEKNQNSKNQTQPPQTQLFEIKSQSQENGQSKIHIEQIKIKKQQKKTECSSSYNPSAFHNFQKHLTIALRLLVQVQSIKSQKRSIQLAKKFWKIFKESSITAKKMLHYILGQKNEHSIDDKLIEKFGFKQLYDTHSESQINQAKSFLREQSLKQLKQANLSKYTSNRRIKNQKNFIMYMQEFMNQLQEGFLKKRVKKQKILKDEE